MLCLSSCDPTESGPTEIRLQRTLHIEPPPKAMLCTSGRVKLVLTPAILTKAEDCLGYPVFSNAQMSVVVLSFIMSASPATQLYFRGVTRQRQQQEPRFHRCHKQLLLWRVRQHLWHCLLDLMRNTSQDIQRLLRLYSMCHH